MWDQVKRKTMIIILLSSTGRLPCWSGEHRSGVWSHRRSSHRQPHGRGQGGLHRVHGGVGAAFYYRLVFQPCWDVGPATSGRWSVCQVLSVWSRSASWSKRQQPKVIWREWCWSWEGRTPASSLLTVTVSKSSPFACCWFGSFSIASIVGRVCTQ